VARLAGGEDHIEGAGGGGSTRTGGGRRHARMLRRRPSRPTTAGPGATDVARPPASVARP